MTPLAQAPAPVPVFFAIYTVPGVSDWDPELRPAAYSWGMWSDDDAAPAMRCGWVQVATLEELIYDCGYVRVSEWSRASWDSRAQVCQVQPAA